MAEREAGSAWLLAGAWYRFVRSILPKRCGAIKVWRGLDVLHTEYASTESAGHHLFYGGARYVAAVLEDDTND